MQYEPAAASFGLVEESLDPTNCENGMQKMNSLEPSDLAVPEAFLGIGVAAAIGFAALGAGVDGETSEAAADIVELPPHSWVNW